MDFTPKTLPTNLQAEQAVLAAVLMNNRALERIGEFLTFEHFTHPAHQEIYKLAERQFSAGIPFDIITAKNYLDQQGVLESVGGVDYLSELAGAGSTVVNVEQYANIIYDNAVRRQLINIGQEIADSAFKEDIDNPATSQIESAEKKLFDLAVTGNSEKSTQPISNALRMALEEAETAHKADGSLSGLTTGFTALDKSLSGLHRSDLIIIAGRPAMGITAFAMNVAFNAASAILGGRANKNFNGAALFFSLEMSATQLAARILSSQSRINQTSIRNGSLTDAEMVKMSKFAEALSNVPLFFDDTASMSVPMMRTRARRIARKHGLSLIVIDYLQLMTSAGGRKNDNRVQEISEITRGLKMIAKELNVPVIALSQLSRSVESREDKRPQLADLRESGSIEQDADIVMFTYRSDYYQNADKKARNIKDVNKAMEIVKEIEENKGKAEIIIGKNRHGKTETVKLAFKGEYSLFEDLEDEVPENTFHNPNDQIYTSPNSNNDELDMDEIGDIS